MDLLSSCDFYPDWLNEGETFGKISYSFKIQKAPLPFPRMKNMKQAHVLVLCFFKIHFFKGIVQTASVFQLDLSFGFFNQTFVCIFHCQCMTFFFLFRMCP
jgi:hypothetical protein